MAVAATVVLGLDSTAGTFTLDVTADPSTSSVSILRAENDGAPYRIAAGLVPSAGSLAYTDMAVKTGTLYSYTVRSIDNAGGTADTTTGTVTGS